MSLIQTRRFNRRTLLGGATAALSLPVSTLFPTLRAGAQPSGATQMEKVTFFVDQTAQHVALPMQQFHLFRGLQRGFLQCVVPAVDSPGSFGRKN